MPTLYVPTGNASATPATMTLMEQQISEELVYKVLCFFSFSISQEKRQQLKFAYGK